MLRGATTTLRSTLLLRNGARQRCRGLCSQSPPPPPPEAGPSSSSSLAQSFWKWTTQQRPSWKESPTEAAVAFVVFGITGSTSGAVVRPTLKSTIGLEGSLREGPWSYRIVSILAVSPIYATMLVTFGTIAGRHRFFAGMSHKIFGRFLPSSVLRSISEGFGFCFPGSRMK